MYKDEKAPRRAPEQPLAQWRYEIAGVDGERRETAHITLRPGWLKESGVA